VYVNKEKNIAINEEVYNAETLKKMEMKESDFETEDELYMSRILEEMTLDTSKFDKRSNFLKFF
jgi:hypothetical protein